MANTNHIPKYDNLFCRKHFIQKKNISFKKCDYKLEKNTYNYCKKFHKRNTIYCQEHHKLVLEQRCMTVKECGCRCDKDKYTNLNYCVDCYFKLFNTNKIPIILSKPKLRLLNEQEKETNKKFLIKKLEEQKKHKEDEEKFIKSNYFMLLPRECLIKIIVFLSVNDIKNLLSINYLYLHDTFNSYFIFNNNRYFINLNLTFEKNVSYFNKIKYINSRYIRMLEYYYKNIKLGKMIIQKYEDRRQQILKE